MVVGFARDNLHLSHLELSKLASDIRDGDMSILLKQYEKEIKVMKQFISNVELYTNNPSHLITESIEECDSW
jgi:hypothetical protein